MWDSITKTLIIKAMESEQVPAGHPPYTTVDAGWAGHPCSLCDEFGLLTRDAGKKLRSVPRDKRGPEAYVISEVN